MCCAQKIDLSIFDQKVIIPKRNTMKKLYFLPLLFLAITSFAQKQFVVQNVTAQTFDDINAAIAAASAGDTLYIPGGGFSLNPATIDKTLHWRGVGHYPDSTAVTGFTQITNAVTFTGNCDNSTFEGIYFQSNVVLGSTDNETTGVTIKRCRIGGILYLRATADISGGNPNLDFRLWESVVVHLDGRFGANARMEKNLIFGYITNFYQSLFHHNLFNYNGTYLFNASSFCQFKNNVFAYSTGMHPTMNNCNFLNNIFQAALPYNPTTSSFTGSGNLINVGWQNVYTSITGNIYTFNYDNDYHLNTGSTGTAEDGTTGVSIIGTATDGTNAGIYGTSLPYKGGAVPYAPHIRSANIDNEADGGNLGVQITVAAQER